MIPPAPYASSRRDRRTRRVRAVVGCALALMLSVAPARVHRGASDRFELAPTSRGAEVLRLVDGPFIVNVWATWCTGCRVEVGALQALARDTGLPVLGVNVGDAPDDIERWLARFGDPYRAQLDDASGTLIERYRIRTLPVTFVVGHDRQIRLRLDEALTAEVLRQRVLPVLRTLGS